MVHGWTLAEEHEDIWDDVAFADGAWNGNAAGFEQKDPLEVDAAPTGRTRRLSAMLWLKRSWLPQGEQFRPVGVLIASAGPGQDAPCECSGVEFEASYV